MLKHVETTNQSKFRISSVFHALLVSHHRMGNWASTSIPSWWCWECSCRDQWIRSLEPWTPLVGFALGPQNKCIRSFGVWGFFRSWFLISAIFFVFFVYWSTMELVGLPWFHMISPVVCCFPPLFNRVCFFSIDFVLLRMFFRANFRCSKPSTRFVGPVGSGSCRTCTTWHPTSPSHSLGALRALTPGCDTAGWGFLTAMKALPSGKHTKNYGKSPFLMGKRTINGHVQ